MKTILLALLALLVLAAEPGPLGARADISLSSGMLESSAPLFLFLDSETFLCSPCLERILASLRDLDALRGRAMLWAVILYAQPSPAGGAEDMRSVTYRRAASLLRANGLACPIVVDESQRWERLLTNGTGLLVLDSRARAVRTFPLPLPPDALDLITAILEEGR